VDHPVLVRRFDAGGNLPADVERLVERQRPGLELLREGRAFDALEDEVSLPTLLFHSVERRHVRVM